MTSEVKYSGHSAQPSDYGVQDGDLSTCVGVVPEDGSLRPVLPPAVILTLKKGESVFCLHVTNLYTHYIVLSESGTLSWIDSEDTDTKTELYTFDCEVYNIATIGNTLIALTSEGMFYFLWKGDEDGYLFLGNHLPELPLSFGLQGTAVSSDEIFTVKLSDEIEESDMYSEDLSDDNVDAVTLGVLAKVNKFIADEATNKGRFIFPFFVRYAYRLYDETLTMHSAPILMYCNSGCAPLVAINHNTSHSTHSEIGAWVLGLVYQLDYMATEPDLLEELRNWSDIVKSVDIFISAPVYTYDQSGEVERFVDMEDGEHEDTAWTVCKVVRDEDDDMVTGDVDVADLHLRRKVADVLKESFSVTANGVTAYKFGGLQYRVELPEKDAATVIKDIQDCSTFYLLKSVDLDDIPTEREVIEVADDYLQSLVNREAMTDDLYSHDTLIPRYAFNYNSRLNVADMDKRLFDGYWPASQVCFCEGGVTTTYGDVNINLANSFKVGVYIKQDGREIIMESPDSVYFIWDDAPVLYLFYPNANAYKAVVQIGDNEYEFKLRTHDFLNGAYCFDGWDDPESAAHDDKTWPTATGDPVMEQRNYIYTTEANDPFNFSIINAVGTGRIIALSSAAKALSQGQFGQFPLYAFASDGVWALTVNDDGSYSAKQPITRDVALSAESVTQLDSAVLFATDRGIMLITGSQTDCISDTINAPEIFSPADLPNSGLVMEVYNHDCKSYETLELADVTHKSFLDFVAECRMIYDYVHQRIIVYNTSEGDDYVRYAYVYSLRSRSWGMMQTRAYRTVASYPKAYAMTYAENGTTPLLVDFSAKSPATEATALIVTRPITIGAPNDFKTISTIIQRGRFPRDAVRQILYGSNDLYTWFPVWSSVDRYLRGFSGTPYKYFRLAMVATLKEAESLYGCTVEYRGRMGNRPR